MATTPVLNIPHSSEKDLSGVAWQRWFFSLQQHVTAVGQIAWATINKTGASLLDFSDRKHTDLTSLNTSLYTHLTAAQAASITSYGNSDWHFHNSDRDSANFYGTSWTDLTDAGDSALHYHATDRDSANFTGTSWTDLTDAGDSALHYHATDRDSANFTGTSWTDLTDSGETTLHAHLLVTGLPTLSAGMVSKPVITNNGDGTLTLGIGTYSFFSTAAGALPIRQHSITAGLLSLTDESVNYIVADYNSGTPTVSVLLNTSTCNWTTIYPIARVFREGTHLDYISWDEEGAALANKIEKRVYCTKGYEAEPGGFALSEAATRTILNTAGNIWLGVQQNTLASFSSATHTCVLYYHVAGVWTRAAITQYNNSQYDDGTALHSLASSRYAVNWIYRSVNIDHPECYVVLGTSDYTAAEAVVAQPPATLPAEMLNVAFLIGRIIVKEGSATAYAIESVSSTILSVAGITDHNHLATLQGGTVDEYYHLTSTQHTDLTDGGNSALHYHPFQIDSDSFGLLNQTETTIAFDGTSTFTLGSVGATWSYYRSGIKYTITGSKTKVLATPMVDGTLYYVFIDATDGTLSSSTSSWTLEDTKVPVATVYWNNTLTPKYLLAEERHTVKISRRSHFYEHFLEGTRMKTVGALTGPTVSATADVDKTCGIDTSVLIDEDIVNTIAALTKPNGVTTSYLVAYRATATTWAWTYSNMPFPYNIGNVSNIIQYDNAGTMTNSTIGTGASKRWVNSYICFANIGGDARQFILPGRAQFTTLALAQAEDPSTFTFPNFISAEFYIAYRVTWVPTSGASSGSCVLAATPLMVKVAAVQTSGSGVSIDHNTLAGLDGGSVGEYFHLTSNEYASIRSDMWAFAAAQG